MRAGVTGGGKNPLGRGARWLGRTHHPTRGPTPLLLRVLRVNGATALTASADCCEKSGEGETERVEGGGESDGGSE